MDYSTPGFPIHHQLLELTQTHVHLVGDAIQPSHPVIPFCSYLQAYPASETFPTNQFFTSGGQSIAVSASASVLPMNMQGWFSLGLTGWISLQSKGFSRVFSSTTSAIKKNTFELVLMRWMKLEPIIQSEVSQKEKHQYSILTHIYGI